MNEKYINAADCEKFFYEHLDDNGITGALNAIEEMPAADVEPVRHGHWITDDSKIYLRHKCSECGNAVILKYPYCENCGAKMDGNTNNET